MNTRFFSRPHRWLPTLAAAALSLNAASASAGTGGGLQAGDMACTDWLRSDGGGIAIRGYAWGAGTYSWTMRMSAAPGATEREIFRAGTREVSQQVTPPATGRFFYRNCLTVTTKEATGYRLVVSPAYAVTSVVHAGPHTATLSPGGRACGEFATAPVILRGVADRPVLFSVGGTDLDYAPVYGIFSVSGKTADQGFDVPEWLSSLDACVTNTARETATVSFDFVEP